MKKQAILILVFITITCIQGKTENRFYGKHKKAVDDQHSSDLANRDAIIKKVKGRMKRLNSYIPREDNVSIAAPVREEHIEGVKETDHVHTTGAIPPRIYGYSAVDRLNMRSAESTKSAVVGQLSFREEVEILYQSEKSDRINGTTSPWLLVKRKNGDEGWVWGGLLSDRVPSKKGIPEKKTDWNMIMPASGRISSRYGYRVDPITRRKKSFHKGIDIAAPKGTPVYAAAAGAVFKASYVKYGYGNLIIVKHRDSLATYYGHLSRILVSKGKKVKKGDLIGRVGTTGRSTGPHLHFEVRKGNKALNPEEFVHQ